MKNIIVTYHDKDEWLNRSVYDYIADNGKEIEKFLVCSVTKEEYRALLSQIGQRGCLDQRFTSCSPECETGRYFMFYECQRCNVSIADYYQLRKMASYTFTQGGITFHEAGEYFPKDDRIRRLYNAQWPKIYTTETYRDILAYYFKLQKPDVSKEEIRSEILKLKQMKTRLNAQQKVEKRKKFTR